MGNEKRENRERGKGEQGTEREKNLGRGGREHDATATTESTRMRVV